MKEETEVKWIINLLYGWDSSLVKKGGSISEYEKSCDAPINSKEFRMWFKKLIGEEIIKFVGYEKAVRGGIDTKIYKINLKNMLDYANTLELYKRMYAVSVNVEMFRLR